MSVMYMLIAFSLIIATGFVIAFVWAIRNGQFDDKYTPSIRILFDDTHNGNLEKTNQMKKNDSKIDKSTDSVQNPKSKPTEIK